MKNTILLFSNMKEPIDELDDEDAGKLFKAILAYQNGEEVKLQGLLKVVFLQIKQQIDYNNERYAETSKKRSEARKAWLLKQQTSTNDNKTQQNPTNDNNTHLYDNENENGNEIENVIENENENVNDNGNENESENVCSSDINIINSPTAHAYGRFSNIILEKHQYDDLKKEFPEADEAIEKMSAYLANEKKTYKNFYARLRLWILQDRKDGKSTEPKKTKKSNPEPYEYKLGAYKV